MAIPEIEQRFIERANSPEEEASIMQHVPPGRYKWLVMQRAKQDRRANLKRLAAEGERLLPILRGVPHDDPHVGPILAAGLALLIEEIHHFNVGIAIQEREG